MTPIPDVDSVMKRTLSSWYEDGLADLTMGGYFLVLGAALLAQALTPDSSPLHLLWGAGIPLVLILGGVAAGWIVKQLKSRLTYPRTGYISFERRQGASRIGRIITVAVIAGLVSAGTVVLSGRLESLTLIFGLITFGTFAYLWQRLGMGRYAVVAFWCLVVGLGLTPLPLTMEQGGAAFWVLAGLGLAVEGFVAWRRFDRTAPQAEASDEGR
jgi:hypothetical protein